LPVDDPLLWAWEIEVMDFTFLDTSSINGKDVVVWIQKGKDHGVIKELFPFVVKDSQGLEIRDKVPFIRNDFQEIAGGKACLEIENRLFVFDPSLFLQVVQTTGIF
jgi:hypothetical protein